MSLRPAPSFSTPVLKLLASLPFRSSPPETLGLSYAPTTQKLEIMRHHSDSIPYVSVRPGSVSIFSLPESGGRRSSAQVEAQKHLEENDHNGSISRKAKRRITQGIDWLLYLANEKTFTHFKAQKQYKFRVNFVTLTLSSRQVHSDVEIKEKLLNQFLIECRSNWGIVNYLWRAEPQKNGNIHFHILIDKFIPWNELRNRWNRIQSKLGYVQRSKHYKEGWTPNSTDIHSVRKVRKLGAYLAKYCTKESDIRAIDGKQWGLSQSLSRMRSAVDFRCSEVIDDLAKLWADSRKRMKEYDYCTVYWVGTDLLEKLGCWKLLEMLEEYVQVVRVEPVRSG